MFKTAVTALLVATLGLLSGTTNAQLQGCVCREPQGALRPDVTTYCCYGGTIDGNSACQDVEVGPFQKCCELMAFVPDCN